MTEHGFARRLSEGDDVGGVCLVALAALALTSPLARAGPPGHGLLAQYQHEADPVRKARVLAKLGDDQIDEAKKATEGGRRC